MENLLKELMLFKNEQHLDGKYTDYLLFVKEILEKYDGNIPSWENLELIRKELETF